MQGYLWFAAKRFVQLLAVIFFGVSAMFVVTYLSPIDPVEQVLGRLSARSNLSPEAIAATRAALTEMFGTNQPVLTQYFNFWTRLLRGDLGASLMAFPTPAMELVLRALPWTLGLLLISTLIAWLLGNMVGLVAGYFHTKKAATILEVVGILLYPIPYYILAVSVILLLAYIFPIFPLSPTFPVGQMTPQKFGMVIYNSLLPALTLVLAGFGWNILSMKALAVATTEEPYVTYARLKGASNWTRMTRYVFRNAMLPQVTALALSLGTVFNGALLTEMLFSYPGVGLIMRTAASGGDYNVLYGAIAISIIAVATAGLIIDLIYPLLDPRIRHK